MAHPMAYGLLHSAERDQVSSELTYPRTGGNEQCTDAMDPQPQYYFPES